MLSEAVTQPFDLGSMLEIRVDLNSASKTLLVLLSMTFVLVGGTRDQTFFLIHSNARNVIFSGVTHYETLESVYKLFLNCVLEVKALCQNWSFVCLQNAWGVLETKAWEAWGPSRMQIISRILANFHLKWK